MQHKTLITPAKDENKKWVIFKYHSPKSENLLTYLTLKRLMSYIYGAPILDVSRSHTTTQHSR